ncbi:UPF0271 protein [Filimonas lacunae]|uniref:5-oxoprolinase subunit A n=1 Tax=Filimonas lacunae TaxID=477680 RepID=A0A173MPZ3_9BACT|nr:5-oxoprolinase subunit PxpA [Filimonas lacunae]BAV09722.1 lactam utilization protein LamB [Filimonas lacunae]SIS77863.1 UPF0271 protein [Filimonas lacunae]
MIHIDINCDLGESFGAYTLGNDEAIMPFITSANIACGFHAGDAGIMQSTIALCKQYNVAVGAHPGFPDIQGFGRRNMVYTPSEIYQMVLYQVGALFAFVKAAGTTLHHVKPHGALYNMAAKDKTMAKAIAQAVKDFDSTLYLYGLAGSLLIEEAQQIQLRTCSEIFADRTYLPDGSLTPRNQPGAMIHDAGKAVEQVLQFITQKQVLAETVCIHGDGEKAVAFAQALQANFQQHHISMQAPV